MAGSALTARAKPVRGMHAFSRTEPILATLLVVLASLPSPVSISLSWGSLLAVPLLPVLLRRVLPLRGARYWLVLALAALPIGWVTARVSLELVDGREVLTGMVLFQSALIVGLALTGIVCVWAVQVLGPLWFVAFWSAGAVVGFLLNGDLANNPWKYGLALPITALLLVAANRSRWATWLVALPITIGLTLASSYRTWLAVVTVGFTAAALGTPRQGKSLSTGVVVLMMVLLGLAVLVTGGLLVDLAVGGWLGDAVQRRTLEQLEYSDNIILGGRAEWGAAMASFVSTPWGFGLGIGPSADDYYTAIRNMPLPTAWHQDVSTVATSFSAGYVSFHSVLWTFWASYGIGGLALVLFMLVVAARGVLSVFRLSMNFGVRALVVIVLVGGMWDLLFSPTSVSSVAACTALALCLGSASYRPLSGFTGGSVGAEVRSAV